MNSEMVNKRQADTSSWMSKLGASFGHFQVHAIEP